MDVVRAQNKAPQLIVCSLEKVTSLCLEHRILVGDRNKLKIVLAFAITNNSLKELANVLNSTLESPGPVHRVANVVERYLRRHMNASKSAAPTCSNVLAWSR